MSSNEEEETLKLKEAIKNYFNTDVSPVVQIRYRPPLIRTSTHDARGDAISLAFESMCQRNFPLWAANILANKFVDLFAAEIDTYKVPFTNDYKAIDSNVWCKRLAKRLDDFIRELADGLHSLPAMPNAWKRFQISFCAQKNRKPKMEDRHIILPTLAVDDPNMEQNYKNDAFFAVFDGHHGAECAAYASAHFVECLIEALSETDDMEEVLRDAFDRIDKRITVRCRNEDIKSGTTASCVYLKNGEVVHLAWCGDSSIGILRGEMADTLSIPHKPEDPEEMKRIEEAGGMVVNIHGVPRLNGVLNLSRALGDIRAKPMVSAKPDIFTYQLSDDDYVLFLASDGVWDNLEEEEIFNSIRTFVTDHPIEAFHLLAEFIAGKAKEAGATDNLTLICVFLKPLEAIWKKFALP